MAPLEHRWASRVVIAVAAAASVACFGPRSYWTDDVAWTADGRRGTLIAEGLHLVDSQGRTTPAVAYDVYRAVWLDHSRVLLARSRTVCNFEEIATAIGPARTRELVDRAERLWWRAQGPGGLAQDEGLAPADADAIAIYLREQHGEAIRARFPDDLEEFESTTVDLHALLIARVSSDVLESGLTLHEGLSPIKDIRPSPDGRVVAFVTQAEGFLSDDRPLILVASLAGSGPAVQVSEDTSLYPEWTDDGRSLYYFAATGPGSREYSVGTYGCLRHHDVVNADGQIDVSRAAPCVVTLAFEEDARLRRMYDGRLLFDAADIDLPHATGPDMRPRRKMFSFDHSRSEGSLQPLFPDDRTEVDVGFFDVSPDRRRVLVGWTTGAFTLLSLETGRTDPLDLGLERATPYSRPETPRAIWSGADAFTYMRQDGAERRLVLRRGETEIVLRP